MLVLELELEEEEKDDVLRLWRYGDALPGHGDATNAGDGDARFPIHAGHVHRGDGTHATPNTKPDSQRGLHGDLPTDVAPARDEPQGVRGSRIHCSGAKPDCRG